MLSKMTKRVRDRVRPVGLSLAAAALTAVAFAAVSVAKDEGSNERGHSGAVELAAPGPGGPPMMEQLSEEDRQAIEEFRQCMQDHGVEPPPGPPVGGAPPAPPPGDEDGTGGDGSFERPIEPPSEEERAKIEQAFEACADKLPEGARGIGPHPCGPPPGAPGGPGADGTAIPAPPRGSGSEQEGAQAPEPQGTQAPEPQGATS